MGRINLNLPEEVQSKACVRAAETGHRSIEDYIESLIRADANQASEDFGAPEQVRVRSVEDLERRVLQGLNSPVSEMTEGDWDQLRRKLEQKNNG